MFRRAACRVLYVICKRKYEGQCGYRQLTRQTVVSRAAGEARHGSTSTRIPDMNVTESPDTTTTSPKHTAVLTSKSLTGQNYLTFEDELFDLLCDENNKVSVAKFLNSLTATGLRQTDPRLYQATHNFLALTQAQLEVDGEDLGAIDRKTFKECVKDNIIIIGRAFRNEFVVPEFRKFTGTIDQLYWKCRNNRAGKVADYIPQLSRFSPDYWGISLCTVDGQRYTVGDSGIPFCLQSCSKALTYGLALSELGPDIVHEFVGQEPSGHSFNELRLDPQRKPHNPMINAGAIVTASLIKSDFKLADRFDYVLNQYRRLAGGEFIGFNNATFLSERETADRNFALGYYMKEHKCFPEGVNLMETMDFYFQLCSIEVNCESGSVMAATLANGGICPITGDRVFDAASVRNTLSLMYSCGMYDYSGQFAFQVGLPAKSGVSGAILLVVPNVMGICCWSPSLDELGNSCRGLQFCQELVKIFNFHNYDNLKHTVKKVDPRIRTTERRGDEIVGLLFGASKGDLSALRRMALSGIDMQQADYDGRTALHLAAAEGHMTCVEFLLDKCKVAHDPKDRWGHTPLDDAQRFERNEVVEVLERYEEGLENVQNLNKEKNEPDYEE